MKKTRVLLVDDHAILRMGLASLIGTEKNLEVVGDAESGEQALQKARQAEILTAIADGLSNTQIADKLGIGPDMVKVHVNALCTKLGAANRAEAVAIALRKHMLKT